MKCVRFLLSLSLLMLSLTLVAQQDSSAYVKINDIVLKGNDVTKSSIIYRELTFEPGDSIAADLLQDEIRVSRENLQNTTLFNFVDIVAEKDADTDGVTVIITMTERWYIWPYPYLVYSDRNLNSWYEANDFSRFSYGFDLEYRNVFGMKHTVKLTAIAGYNQNYGLSYDVPYLDKSQSFGVEFGGGYKRDKEIAYDTENNKVQYFNVDEQFARQTLYAFLKPYYRFGHRNRLFFAIEYNDTRFHDSLQYLNDDFANRQGTRFQYLSLSMTFKNDFRDEQNYPLDGHYFETQLQKNGLGVFETAPDDFFGKMTFDWYQPIKGRWYWASNVTAKFSYGSDVKYFLNQGLGYKNDYVRTYDLYVVDAANFALMKNNLKFAIMNPTTRYISFIKNERFGKIHFALYANVFFDCAYSWNMPEATASFLDNRFIFGTGVGIDFVTYYDKVIRLEYGVNDMGETGLFVHLVAPI